MNNHQPTPAQIRTRLLAAALALAVGLAAIVIAVLEVKSVLA